MLEPDHIHLCIDRVVLAQKQGHACVAKCARCGNRFMVNLATIKFCPFCGPGSAKEPPPKPPEPVKGAAGVGAGGRFYERVGDPGLAGHRWKTDSISSTGWKPTTTATCPGCWPGKKSPEFEHQPAVDFDFQKLGLAGGRPVSTNLISRWCPATRNGSWRQKGSWTRKARPN